MKCDFKRWHLNEPAGPFCREFGLRSKSLVVADMLQADVKALFQWQRSDYSIEITELSLQRSKPGIVLRFQEQRKEHTIWQLRLSRRKRDAEIKLLLPMHLNSFG